MSLSRLGRAAHVVHPFPSFLVAATALVLAFIADAHGPATRYLAIGLGMLLFQFTIGAANDVVDIESDRLAKPSKPLAAGLLKVRTAAILAGIFCVAGLGVTALLPLSAWLIGLALLACGLSYDFWLKRTPVSWLPYAAAFSLLPVWVFVASDAWGALIWWVLPIGMLLGFALHLANQAPDVGSDPRDFLGLPEMLGEKTATRLATGCFVLAAIIAAVVLSFTTARQTWIVASIGILVLLLSPFAPRAKQRDALFGLLALGTAALAITFLSAV